jgi:RNA polymerase sigma factor (sigma-70 family)
MSVENPTTNPTAPENLELSLLERVGNGDKRAVPLLLDKYGALVWSIARKQVGADAAEDLVQEIFIQIWSQAGRFDPTRASEATFLTMIARRRSIDFSRKVGRRPSTENLVVEIPAEQSELESIDLVDEARVAYEALVQLNPEQQEVLRLGIFEGLTHNEISGVTKLPLGTVKSHSRRGLERVRAILKERQENREVPK